VPVTAPAVARAEDSEVSRAREPVVDVVLPVYNEVAALSAAVGRLRDYLDERLSWTWCITVADNASTDGSWEKAKQLAAVMPEVRVVHLDAKGRGRALRTAWSTSDAAVVCYMDLDLSTDLEAMSPLLAPIVEGRSDISIGSRLVAGSRVTRSFKRELLSRTYNRLLHMVFRNRFKDAQCGFKALRSEIARRLLPEIRDNSWFFDTELLLLAERNGMQITEIPVDWVDDPDSRVAILPTVLGDLWGIARMALRFWTGHGRVDPDHPDRAPIAPEVPACTRTSADVAPEVSPTPRWWVRQGRPAWALPVQGAIALVALALYTWNLSLNGLGNAWYSAAVKSGTESWKAFFFGSFDPASFTTVDKPPAALWVQEISARIFGFSSWSLLMPEAIAGVVSVLVVHRLVRRWSGEVAAVLASLAFALTPIAVVMFRFNNPDAILTLLLLLSAWALWSAVERGSTWKLVLCGALLGLAFTTKTLQAFIVLPAFGLVYLVTGPPALRRRIYQLLLAGVALVVASSWWVAIVELWPKASRPYIAGSTNNSEINLIFGYNGFSRILGGAGAGPAPNTGGLNFGGGAGWLRVFDQALGGQVSWLVPLALAGLVGGLWLAGRAPRTDRLRAGCILWGGWTLMHLVVFSEAKGIFHPYYSVALAPGVAALAGAGSVALWRLGRRNAWYSFVLPAAVVVTAVWAAELLGRTPHYDSGLAAAIVATGIVAAIGLWTTLARLVRGIWLAVASAVVAAVSTLAGPSAYALSSASRSITGSNPTAGPQSTAGASVGLPGGVNASSVRRFARSHGFDLPGNFEFPERLGRFSGAATGAAGGDASVSLGLTQFLEAHRGHATFLVASDTATAESLIISTGQPVMDMGGFTGTDPHPTLAEFKHLVATGQVHYVLVGGGPGGGFGGGPFPGGGFHSGEFPRVGDLPSPGAGAGLGPGTTAGNGAARRAGFGTIGTSSTVTAVYQWVEQHGKPVPAASYGGSGSTSLYYVSSATTSR
jgi:4-amino-4-deoxy-L-arabinose transferase-like glycosyltransferase